MTGADFLNAVGASPHVKTIHMAALISPTGEVSPLCAKRPKAIDLTKASWTNRSEAVTCRRCRSMLAAVQTPLPTGDDSA